MELFFLDCAMSPESERQYMGRHQLTYFETDHDKSSKLAELLTEHFTYKGRFLMENRNV